MKTLTCSYYLRGMITRQSSLPMECIEFLYSSSHYPNEIIKADLLSIPGKDDIGEQILLNDDEKIIKIHVNVQNVPLIIDGILQSVSLVAGIQFFTRTARTSRLVDVEEFDIYPICRFSIFRFQLLKGFHLFYDE